MQPQNIKAGKKHIKAKSNSIQQQQVKKPGNYLQVSDGEDDGVRQVHLVGVFVNGGRDDWRVDDDGVIGGQRFAAQLHAGVLRGQVAPDVFVQDEGDANLTCGEKRLR